MCARETGAGHPYDTRASLTATFRLPSVCDLSILGSVRPAGPKGPGSGGGSPNPIPYGNTAVPFRS